MSKVIQLPTKNLYTLTHQLINLMRSRRGVLIAGSINTGKTTLAQSVVTGLSSDSPVFALLDTTFPVKKLGPNVHKFKCPDSINDYPVYRQTLRCNSPGYIMIDEIRDSTLMPFIVDTVLPVIGVIHQPEPDLVFNKLQILLSAESNDKEESMQQSLVNTFPYIVFVQAPGQYDLFRASVVNGAIHLQPSAD